jgi:Leucine-rich repeat (LRR) protein
MSQEQIEFFYNQLNNNFKIKYDENNNIIEFDCQFQYGKPELSIIPQDFIDTKLKYVKKLNCTENDIKRLDLKVCTLLKELYCHQNNELSFLDISKCIELEILYYDGCQLPTLDISNNTKLTIIYCHDNKIGNLNVSHLIHLKELLCHCNNLSTLDISNNRELEELWCYSNNLTSLHLSNNIKMKKLRCDNNKLMYLDLYCLIELEKLYCYNNYFRFLDIFNNTKLIKIEGRRIDDSFFAKPIWYFVEKRRKYLERKYLQLWRLKTNKRKSTLIYKCFKNIKKSEVEITSSSIPIDLYNDYIHYVV